MTYYRGNTYSSEPKEQERSRKLHRDSGLAVPPPSREAIPPGFRGNLGLETGAAVIIAEREPVEARAA